MNPKIKRREAIKALAAFGGLLASSSLLPAGIHSVSGDKLAVNWSYEGKPCLIYQQGALLLLINEVGSVASGKWTGPDTFVVLAGAGWDAGLTAQISANGKSIQWSNETVWNKGGIFHPAQNLSGNWTYQGQPCAIFQQGNLLLLVNEAGAIGSGIWTVANSFTVLGGAGWDLGLVARVADQGKTINWSNETVWTRK